ncbi:aromatic amino acid transaminase [Variovorax sp. LARHSF232]
MFAHVPAYGGDPILSLMEDFQKDPRADKVSLGIGIYLDEQGRLPVLDCVRQAESIGAQQVGPRPYLPIEGAAAYRQALQAVVFGADSEAVKSGRIATLQSLGGSGALKVGADFLRHYFGDAEVWVSDPTWDNHVALFEGAGLKVNSYPYYDAQTGRLRFDAMLAAFGSMPSRSVVLLHASCHNPTGIDLSVAQWQALIEVIAKRGLIPFVDMAYQGFGDGLDEDSYVIRAMADSGVEFLVANSFSKNFSLYGERCGGLSVVCASKSTADAVLGQLKATVRRNYSSPPTYGQEVIARILNTPELDALWQRELSDMRARIKSMRERLHHVLNQHFLGARNFNYFLSQRGMFSYTGLSETQVNRLREEHAIYLLRSGRMCLPGLNAANVDYVADAMVKVLK